MNNKHGLPITDHGSQNRNFRAAFTLAELLIATGITSGLVVMLGWTLGSLMSTASHANERVASHLSGKIVKRVVYVPGKILNIVLE